MTTYSPLTVNQVATYKEKVKRANQVGSKQVLLYIPYTYLIITIVALPQVPHKYLHNKEKSTNTKKLTHGRNGGGGKRSFTSIFFPSNPLSVSRLPSPSLSQSSPPPLTPTTTTFLTAPAPKPELLLVRPKTQTKTQIYFVSAIIIN